MLKQCSNSLINVDGAGSTIDGATFSIILGSANLNINNIDQSIVFGDNNTATNLDFSALQGSGNTATNLSRVAINSIGLTISNSQDSTVKAFGGIFDNVAWSNINSFNADVTNMTWSNVLVNGGVGPLTTINNVDHFTGEFLGSNTINGIYTGNGIVSNSNVSDSGGFYGAINLTDTTSTTNIVGIFGGYCQSTNPVGPAYCGSGYDITYDIHDSGSLVGMTRWTNIYSSKSNFLNVNSTDPLVYSSSLNNVNYSFVQGYDIAYTNVSESIFIGNDNIVQNTSGSIGIGANQSLDGLEGSIIIGNNVAIVDTGDNDYSYIGSNAAGAINTRINSNGYDSWLNLSGGNVGVGTNTPTSTAAAGNLEVTGNIRIDNIDGGPDTNNVCINGTGDLMLCSSSRRYKENIKELGLGLETLMQLKAVQYDWKGNGQTDIGFIAEDTAAISSLLATYNKNGEIQGVKYDKLTAVITNAVQQQQGKIEDINKQLSVDGLAIDSLSDDLRKLAGRVDNLEAEVKDLKATVKQLEQKVGTSDAAPSSTNPTTGTTKP